MGVCQILCVSFFPFGIEGRMWDVIVLIPDHYLSIYFSKIKICDKRDDFGIDIVNVNMKYSIFYKHPY